MECTFDNSAGLEFCDIGANLTDRMYSGEYNGKQKHEPDLEAVVARAGAAGVRRLMITGGCLEDAGAALAMARSAGTDGVGLFCTVGVHPTRASEFEASGDPERHLAQLLKLAQDGMETGHVVAIGECGLCVHALRVLGHPDTHSQFPAPEHAID